MGTAGLRPCLDHAAPTVGVWTIDQPASGRKGTGVQSARYHDRLHILVVEQHTTQAELSARNLLCSSAGIRAAREASNDRSSHSNHVKPRSFRSRQENTFDCYSQPAVGNREARVDE